MKKIWKKFEKNLKKRKKRKKEEKKVQEKSEKFSVLLSTEINGQVFSKTTGVVIPNGFGVAEGLQQRIRLQYLLADQTTLRLIHHG